MTAGVSETAQYWALGIFFLGIIGMCAFMLAAPYFLGGRAWGRAKNEPFESGIVSQGGARIRVSAKFYLVAMFFVIFDVKPCSCLPTRFPCASRVGRASSKSSSSSWFCSSACSISGASVASTGHLKPASVVWRHARPRRLISERVRHEIHPDQD